MRVYHQSTLEEYRERFYSKVKRIWHRSKTGKKYWCLEWQAGHYPAASKLDEQGYGAFWFQGSTRQAHRVAYYFKHGKWPSKFLCHKCNNPPCVRLKHLVKATPKQNSEHMVISERTATGARNGKYTNPEATPRGDRSGARKHPEAYPKGSDKPQSKLTERQAIKIKRLYATNKWSQSALARKFGVHQTLIGFIVRGVYWKHVK